jgi:hypothetical protein
MKRSRRCPKCESEAIGHLDHLPDTMGSETEIGEQAIGLVMRGTGPEKVGRLEAYVCTTCGYLETYVQEPDKVPFDEIVSFSWIGGEGSTPYR